MTDQELIAFVADFRDGILEGKGSYGMCFMVSAPLAGLLRMCGVEVKLVGGENDICNHFWLELHDGRVLDPTADQFSDEIGSDLPPVYLGPALPAIHRSAP